MGFERVKDSEQPNAERGFENADIDLESDELSQLKTVRASKKRSRRSTVEVKTGMKRDRMGRRGYNNEENDNAEGADMIAPDRPIRIASGSGRQSQAQYNAKPFKSENSEFGDLFDSSEGQAYSADSSRFSRLDGLAYDEKQDGDGERFAHIFSDDSAAPMVHRGENMVQELMRERQREDEEQQRQLQGVSSGGSFGLAEERMKEKEKSRFSRRDKKNKPEKTGREANKMDKERDQIIIQPNAEPYSEEQDNMAYQGQMPPYGYPQQPYGYPQYPQQPYGYPQYPQQPYGYPPYPQQPYGYPQYPQPPYGYPPYPQQPYGYPQYPQPPYGYPPYPQQPYGYPPMQEQGAQPVQRPLPDERPRSNPAVIMPPERKAEENRPAEQPAPQKMPPAAEPIKEEEPEQLGGSRFNRRSKGADAAAAEPAPPAEEKPAQQAEEIPLEEPPAMPSKFTRRSKDTKPEAAAEPIKPEQEEMPRFERRSRNAPMDAEALSMPSGNSPIGADDDDDMPMPVSRFKRRNRSGAPD